MFELTHPPSSVEKVVSLASSGLPASTIAARVGIPRGTVRDWLGGRVPTSGFSRRELDLYTLPPAYAYLLGLYLGDGCLARHPREVYKLRLALDAAYPGIVDSAVRAVQAVMPGNKVNRCLRETWAGWSHPRYSFVNLSSGIRSIFCDACDILGLHWTWAQPNRIYVSRVADVALLDECVGPKA